MAFTSSTDRLLRAEANLVSGTSLFDGGPLGTNGNFGGTSYAGLGNLGGFGFNGQAPLQDRLGLETMGTSTLAFKTAEFERAMEGQQAGVNTFQWTVLRDQFAGFARELAIVRNETAACAKVAMQNEVRHAETYRVVQTMQAEIEREAATRQRDDEVVLSGFNTLKQSIEKESYARAVRIEENTRAVKQALEIAEAERLERQRSVAALDAQTTSALRTIQGEIEKERTDRVQAFELTERQFRELSTALRQELSDRNVADEGIAQSLRQVAGALDQEKADRMALGSASETRWNALQGELKTEAEQRGILGERCDRRFVEHRELVVVERLAREALRFEIVEAVENLRTRQADDTARLSGEQQAARSEYRDLLVEHKASSDLRIAAERQLRDEQHTATMASLAAVDTELRREIGRAIEETTSGDTRLREMLADQKETQERQLRAEIQQVKSQMQAEHTRLRDADISLGVQAEQLGNKLKAQSQELGDAIMVVDETLQRGISKVADDLNVASAKARAEESKLKDHIDAMERDIRRSIGQVNTDSVLGDERLQGEIVGLAGVVRDLDTKFKDSIDKTNHQARANEQEIRIDLSRNVDSLQASHAHLRDDVEQRDLSVRAEISRVHNDLFGGLSELRAHVERRYASCDEALSNEKKLREVGDSSLFERLEAYQRQEKDDIAGDLAGRENLRQECQSTLLNFRQFLEQEKEQRIVAERQIGNQLNILHGNKVNKPEYADSTRRLWEAMDSHTHQMQPPPPQVIVEERIVQAPPQVIVEERIVQAPPQVIVQSGTGPVPFGASVRLPSPTAAAVRPNVMGSVRIA